MRLSTGPTTRVCRSKYRRPIGSSTWHRAPTLDSGGHDALVSRLSVQYVPRHPTTEFTVRNGHFVNGIRSVGVTSNRDSPWSDTLTSFVVSLRTIVTYSVFTPKYIFVEPMACSARVSQILGNAPVV